ncbi:hypothetical protein NSA27_08705 [Clostridium tepidum]|uniref:hypothetical protein n=1 Tax=Clostridium tepidum TaxID=1962263 RepID=UPI00214A51A9|nr:hypothetical protein [Clostridium tepidum]MCR1934762.1 hypothetical protein [Clostridium tepidum]
MKNKAKTNKINSINKLIFSIPETKPRIRHIIGYPKNSSDKSEDLFIPLFKIDIMHIGTIKKINEIIKKILSFGAVR